MIQGGDASGTGRGGVSIYGDRFEDEIDGRLLHVGAGKLIQFGLISSF
jgi:peptidyl-prolyl cis-trans isomerase-like 1